MSGWGMPSVTTRRRFCSTVSQGSSSGSWNITPVRTLPRRTRPVEGGVQAEQNAQRGAFADAGGAEQRDHLAACDGEGDVAQHDPLRAVGGGENLAVDADLKHWLRP